MRVRSCRRSYRTGGRTEHDNHPTYHGEWHDMNGGCACGGAGESPPPFPLGEPRSFDARSVSKLIRGYS